MKKIKTLLLITFFLSLFSVNINAEKSNEIKTNKVISDEASDQLKKLLDLYKDGVITGYEYEKEKKKILN
jgi:O-phosphoseryl-tRNA(Cys) synthetase